jgi:HEAT repeat protein
MRMGVAVVFVLCLLTVGGCSRKKTTGELIDDLKSSDGKDRLIAVRLLGERKEEAALVIPALIEALKDREPDIRLSAAIGLGTFGDQARDGISSLQAMQRDADARVRRAAGIALSRIDPGRFPAGAERRPAP